LQNVLELLGHPIVAQNVGGELELHALRCLFALLRCDYYALKIITE